MTLPRAILSSRIQIYPENSGARTKEEAARITVVFNAGKGCARRFHLPTTYARPRRFALSRGVSYATEFRREIRATARKRRGHENASPARVTLFALGTRLRARCTGLKRAVCK